MTEADRLAFIAAAERGEVMPAVNASITNMRSDAATMFAKLNRLAADRENHFERATTRES